jgi:hypothetical protein
MGSEFIDVVITRRSRKEGPLFPELLGGRVGMFEGRR